MSLRALSLNRKEKTHLQQLKHDLRKEWGMGFRGLEGALPGSKVGAVKSMWYQWKYFKSGVEYNIFVHTFSVQFMCFTYVYTCEITTTIKGVSICIISQTFLIPLGMPHSTSGEPLFSWSIDNIAFSRTLHKWNHIICIFCRIPFTCTFLKKCTLCY